LHGSLFILTMELVGMRMHPETLIDDVGGLLNRRARLWEDIRDELLTLDLSNLSRWSGLSNCIDRLHLRRALWTIGR